MTRLSNSSDPFFLRIWFEELRKQETAVRRKLVSLQKLQDQLESDLVKSPLENHYHLEDRHRGESVEDRLEDRHRVKNVEDHLLEDLRPDKSLEDHSTMDHSKGVGDYHVRVRDHHVRSHEISDPELGGRGFLPVDIHSVDGEDEEKAKPIFSSRLTNRTF